MGKYKHGKPNAEINLEDFKTKLDKSGEPLRYKAYAIILYWIGCRRSEPIAIIKKDIVEKDGRLFVTIPAYKHGQRGGSIELPLQYYGVDKIKEAWTRTRKGRKVFPFCAKTGYRIIKRLYPKKSPHWFRHNRITKLRRKIDGETISLDDVKSFTGIKSDRTLQTYGMTTREGIHRVSNILD